MCKNIIGMANINAQEFQNIGIHTPPIKLQREHDSSLKRCPVPEEVSKSL